PGQHLRQAGELVRQRVGLLEQVPGDGSRHGRLSPSWRAKLAWISPCTGAFLRLYPGTVTPSFQLLSIIAHPAWPPWRRNLNRSRQSRLHRPLGGRGAAVFSCSARVVLMTALACVGWSAGLANAHAQMPTEQAASVAGGEPERMALGLIVKLKEPGPAPTFSARAHRAGQRVSRASSMSLQRERDVLATVTQRHRVSYLVQRRTAFAANLIHAGHPVRLSEAREQARRLRADPQVEWVVVNEIEKPAALTPPNDTHHGSPTSLHSPTGPPPARPWWWLCWTRASCPTKICL